jgi:N-acetylated-alpha-linked acidic dipeptidase
MARVLGLEALRMADTDVLPYDYVTYAYQIDSYIAPPNGKRPTRISAASTLPPSKLAAARLTAAAQKAHALQSAPTGDLAKLNQALRQTETALISDAGLPNRPWYRHTIYAPGEYTGYAAVVIPGVNEAIDAKDTTRAAQQLVVLTQALDRAAQTLASRVACPTGFN